MYKAGIDIGGTKINVGLLDSDNRIAFKKTVKIGNNKDCKSVMRCAADMLNDIFRENKLTAGDISACGIGVPGTVDKAGKIAVKVPNLGWANAPVVAEFERLTGFSATLIQDSRAAAYCESIAGSGRGKSTVVCVTLGTGIGTGVVIDGKIFEGSLGGAGEVGHLPAVENGRPCGCGKRGCLEKYAAGGGLDITAREMYGEGANSSTLFEKAENGDAQAKAAIANAVQMLGHAMVLIVNLLSPDCLIFSGGLSQREKRVMTPLMEYINAHCYALERIPEMIMAEWGEDAPMAGAALYAKPFAGRVLKMSASVMCADILHLEKNLEELEDAGINYLHFDVMDGHFVPNLMLPYEFFDRIRAVSHLPFDIHLMIEDPENTIPKLHLREGDIVSVHSESTPHLNRALGIIRDKGATPAVALNPGTPLYAVEDVLGEIGMLLLMTVNPGYAGQPLVNGAIQKIQRARRFLDERGYAHIPIEIDGNCSFENIPQMYAAGAEIFVGGSSGIFHRGGSIEENMKKIQETTK